MSSANGEQVDHGRDHPTNEPSTTQHDPHQHELMRAAARLGVTHCVVAGAPDTVAYTWGEHEVRVRKGRVFPSLSRAAEALCDHKQRCKDALDAIDVRTPAGLPFWSDDTDVEPRMAALLAERAPLVCKPVDGTHGEGVALDLRSAAAVLTHAQRHSPTRREWVAESQHGGHDLRLQAIAGQLFAACMRVPAAVEGDGVQTVAQLLAARDAEVRALNPRNQLTVDDEVRALLAAQGLTLTCVPGAGLHVRLRQVANMAQGARAIDVTDTLHPGWRATVARIAEHVGIAVFAVDARVTSAEDPPHAGVVLELNARPEWLHHTFSEGRQHDVGAALLRASLPGLP
ncbi:MAG: hypothetical protein R3B40_16615 [Polyangiales bacterium]